MHSYHIFGGALIEIFSKDIPKRYIFGGENITCQFLLLCMIARRSSATKAYLRTLSCESLPASDGSDRRKLDKAMRHVLWDLHRIGIIESFRKLLRKAVG